MKTAKRIAVVAGCALMAALLGGCAGSYQARSVDLKPDTILVNPDIFQKGTGDQVLYRYVNPAANFKVYSKIMIDPVLIYKQGELDTDQLENYQKLANNAFVYLNQELATQLTVVTVAGPDTIRLQFAIVDAEKSAPVRNLLSTLSPIGIGLNIVKYGATGKQMGVGEITAEIRATDSTSGQLLAAGYDRRVGGKAAQGIWETWYNADQALQYWAKKSAWFICDAKGGTTCVQPGD
jgi:hypothetical protein